MPFHIRPVLSSLLVLALLGSLLVSPHGTRPAKAQEADTDVPIVQVGGTVHADLFTGQATMSLPLEVLPGRQGLQPELALVYGSANGNGWVGMGWKLEKGVIERNLKFGVDYTADDYVFRLNGVNIELVNIGGDEYQAKIEGSFTRIQKKTGAAGPYFEATDRFGTRYIFGETARVADPDDATRVFRWCLERMADPNGNYMEFAYESFEEDNQAYLKTIAYTGHEGEGLAPTTTVAFELEDRPDAPTLYTTHFPMRTAKRLKTIVINAPSGEAMRSYQLAYHTTLSSSGRSLLQSVTECGRPRDNGDGTVTETCLPAQTFTYTTPQGVTFSDYLQSLPLEGTSCSTGSGCRGRTDVPQGPVGPSDVDGNGRMELLALSHLPKTGEEPPPDPDPQGQTPDAHTNCVVSASIPGFSHGSLCTWFYDSHTNYGLDLPEERTNHWAPFKHLEVTAPVRGTPDHRLAEGPTGFADITGNGATEVYQWDFDGMIDLHIPQLDGDRRVLESWVSLPDVLTWDSFSETTDPQELNYRIGFADIDGDGQADFWGRKGLTVEVHLAKAYDAANQAQTFEPAQTFTWAEMGPLGSPMGFVDVNGDGEADFWGWRADGDLEIRLSQGDGTVGSAVILPWVNDPNRERPLGFADINGDGLADFWGWAVITDEPYVTGHLYYALAKGDGSFAFQPSLFWADPPAESSPPDPETDFSLLGQIGFADVNGDGKADLYGWKPNEPGITVHLTQADGTISATAETVGWTGSAGSDGPFGFADMTGDGLADFYGWTQSGWGGQVNILRAGGEKPDLLVGVENGLGGAWTVTYASTADSAHSAEQTQLPFALPLVEEVLVDDGFSNLSRTTYGVTGGYYHLGERDFRGFHRAEMSDPRGFTTRTWFHQGNDVAVDVNDPAVANGYLKGAIYRKTVTIPDPNNQGGFGEEAEIEYAKTETIYAADTDSRAPFFSPPQTQTQWRCGEDGACQVSQIDWVYDAYGNPLQEAYHGDLAVSGDERTVSRSFSPNVTDWLVAYPDRETWYSGVGPGTRVAQTDFVYDGGSGAPTQGNLTTEIRWHDQGADVITQWTYDAYGNRLTRMEAATGATTTWTYDASQTFVVTETNALTHPPIRTAYYGVDGEAIDTGLYGQLKRVTDANGAVTTRAYDRLGRVTRVTLPDGLFTDTAYQYFGEGVGTQRVQTYWEHTNAPNDQVYPNSPYGELARQWFDGLGRVIKDQQPGTELNYERTTDMTYDARGLLVTQSLPHFAVPPPFGEAFITYTYDELGRVKTVSYPDGRVEHTCYGGGATATVDANGHKRRTARDPYGQVVTVQEYGGEFTNCSPGAGSPAATTAYDYDALGNLTRVTDAQGNFTAMDYDSLSRKIQMDEPDMGTWTYAYDAGGNLLRQTDAKGQILHFQYDLLHRRVQKDYDTVKALGSGDVMWSYDRPDENGRGRLTTVEHTTASIPSATEFGYDQRGRLTRKTETIGAQTFIFLQTYDGLDRETSKTYPDGSVVETTYYGAYLSQVREQGGETYATLAVAPNPLGYTELGQPTNLASGNGVTTAYTYDDYNYRLKTLNTSRCDEPICVPGTLDPTSLQSLAYDYDAGGNVTGITDPQHSNQSFLYDARDRLTQGTVGAVTRTYTYDAIGNMLSNSQVGTYTYPPSGPSSVRPHAVTTAGPYTYTYDANGNLTTGANRTIEYDHDNRPITITSTGYGGPPVAPTITMPPADRTVAVGGSATFTVVATGTAPVSYQWRRDGVDIPGAIGTGYTLPSTTLNDSGAVLTVEVQNPAGTVTSAGATLTVVPTYALTVTMEGTGSGTVTSDPAGIACPGDCTEAYAQGTSVTLTPTVASGSIFRSWNGGGCSGTGNCVVTMDQAQNVTATFGRFLASWPLEGDASDTSGQGQDGVIIGTPLTVAGQFGQALAFDGNQEYISLPTGSLTANQSEVTLALWVRPEVWGNMMVLYAEDLREGSFPFETFNGQFAIGPSGWVTRDTTTGTTGTPNNTLTIPDLSGTLGAWHHLTFVYSVSEQRKAIYLDGTLVNATSVSIDPLTGSRNDAALGSSSSVGAFWGGDESTRYQGALDEVRLFDYALTDAEIAGLAGSPPPTATSPSITAQPQNVTVTEPAGATFTVTASGTAPLSYQWQRNGANIAGATSASYTLSPTASADSGATFAVVVSNSAGSVTSASATLTVQPAASPPTITAQPQNVTLTEPASATFTVTASGTAPLSYQWQRNGATIAGATSASYTLSPTASADSGATFAVVVSNSAGNVTSANATLTVQPAVNPGPFTLTVGVSGIGTVTSTPSGIDCGYSTSACTTDYAGGTLVTLTANPFTLYQLSSWGGACSGSATTCVVTMNQAQTVTATFAFSFGALEEPGLGGGTYLVSADSGASEEGSGELAHQFASRPSPASAGLRPWDFAPPYHGSRSPYLHLAAFRSPGSQLPTALQQVTEEQDAAQHQLDEVLVRTQAAPPDGTVTTFVYNGEGQRIIKQVEDWVTVYLGQDYVCHGTEHAVRNGGDLACAKLIYANGQRVAMVQVDTGKTTYFHSDHLGSTSVVTDDTGAVEQELAYWAFGETRVNSSSQNVDIAYKYTGQEEDRTTGLYDYHARLYDPLIGRFTQPDTIVPQPFNPQSLNRYSYVLNNPLKYTDPTGYTQTLATVNVFAAHEPAPSYTYSGGTLPHSGPTYNDYNPTGPASMNLVSGGNTTWPSTTPTSGGGRKGNPGRSQQGLDISAQGQDFNFLHLTSDLKQPAPQIHGPGPAAGNAPGVLNDLYRSILKLKRGRNVDQAFEALALQVPNGQKTFGTVIIHPDRVQVFDAFLGKGPYLSNPDLGFVPIIRPITGTNPLLPGAKDPPYPPGLGPKLPLFNPPLKSYEELR